MGHTPGPYGIEQTRDMLWVGPMRPDGHKVDEVVVGLTIDSQLTQAAALRQFFNARLIAAAPDLLAACQAAEDFLASVDSDEALSIYDQLHAAIARATGASV